LRKRLGEPGIIATLAGAGYRIDAPGREGGDRG
jgi:two-component system response regulator VanR